jgi:Fe-S cluster biogenesis protein NfuA
MSTTVAEQSERTMKEQVLGALNKVRPALQADGGDLELVEVTEDGVVMVRLHGACGGCPMSTMTLTYGIERYLRQQVPGVTQLVPIE